MKLISRFLLLIAFFLVGASVAFAVPPPDFLFNVGSQIVQFFSIAVLFLSAIAASMSQFAKVFFMRIQHKKLFWISIGLSVVIFSFGAAYYYGRYEQQKAYKNWIAESETQNKDIAATDTSLDQLKIQVPETSINPPPSTLLPAPQTPPSPPPEDKNIQFIRTYYNNLSAGKIAEAYAVSKKSVSLETYKSWYKDLTSLTVDNLQPIDEKSYSLRLTLNEAGKLTQYAVLMTLAEDTTGSLKIASSEVRILSAPKVKIVETAKVPRRRIVENTIQEDDVFFEQNKNLALAVTNEEFQQITGGSAQPYVLDAREDEEFEIGYFQGSNHIRFADLLAGEWIRLPTDKVIYVFCWSGIRGKEVAEFLRSKKILARYVENGADKWVAFGGTWTGGIKFLSKYTEDRYKLVFTLEELRQRMADGAFIVDSRIKSKYDAWHITGSINIPIIYTPSVRIEELLAQVPAGKKVITMCDDFVSCFDAKVTGVKLEKKGHEFLGRYNKPWEYRGAQ